MRLDSVCPATRRMTQATRSRSRRHAISAFGLAAALLWQPVSAVAASDGIADASALVNADAARATETTNARKPGLAAIQLRTASVVDLPGTNTFPESVTAAPDGTLFTSSIPAGAIYRVPAGSVSAEPLLAPGSRPGVAGVLFDASRHVLWACIVDLTGAKPSALEALDPASGQRVASYALPAGGLCADIALADPKTLYVTDTIASRILRLTTPPGSAAGGELAIWSAEPVLAAPEPGPIPLGLNGIGYDAVFHRVFVGKYNSGQLFAVGVNPDGTAGAAREIVMDQRYPKLDGIRVVAPGMVLGAVNKGPVIAVNVLGDRVFTHVLAESDQPSSLTVSPDGIWIAEGQVERLQGADPSPVNAPFKLRRLGF